MIMHNIVYALYAGRWVPVAVLQAYFAKTRGRR
jgi:hypothetical protein